MGDAAVQVVEVGGFWQIEDEIAEQEELGPDPRLPMTKFDAFN